MPYAPEHDEIPNPLRPGLRADSAPEPCAVVIFGASGDLAHRKLVPALYNLAVGAHLPAAFGIVGGRNCAPEVSAKGVTSPQ